jgi:hypothetical protein
MANDIVQTRWYIHLMVRHGNTLIASIMKKLKRPVMYVSR